jgi:transcriptional regulator with XRE-family HTH domain
LVAARSQARMSQEELGWRAALHRTDVGILERGTRCPRIDTLVKLAGALEVPPWRLLDGIEWRPSHARPGRFEKRMARPEVRQQGSASPRG